MGRKTIFLYCGRGGVERHRARGDINKPATPNVNGWRQTTAVTRALSCNPYKSIVTRNAFELNPITIAPSRLDAPPSPPPPKITLRGVTTILGSADALFDVAGVVRDGGRPSDESYIFTEGEEQDGVEVTKIDTRKNIVSFMNHGVEQDISLVDGVASSGSAPSVPTGPGRARKLGRIPGLNGGDSPGGFEPKTYSPHSGVSQLSDDDQAALVAAAHAQAMQNNDPTAPMFPPTQFDQQAQDEARK